MLVQDAIGRKAKVVQRKEGVFLQLELDPERLLGIENRGGGGGSLRAVAETREQSVRIR